MDPVVTSTAQITVTGDGKNLDDRIFILDILKLKGS